MCTLSWITRRDGYDLLCNRDERRTRAEAEPPSAWSGDGGHFLAPRDPEGGGSWISVNEHGLSLCLLNHYAADTGAAAPSASAGWLSRGQVINTLADRSGPIAVRDGLDALALRRFSPFLLLALTSGTPPMLWRWDGQRLQEEALPQPPITTSAIACDEVRRSRRVSFRRLCGEGPDPEPPSLDQLYAWHRATDPQAPHASVAMDREEATTVSLTHIRVGPAGIEMRYFAGHPSTTREAKPAIARLPGVTGARLPGDRPPRRVEPATFDVRALFHEKNPRLARRIPRAGFALLERLGYQQAINRGLYALRDTPCRQFPARALEYLGVTCDVHGPRPPGPEQRPIFTANHPLGAIDGMAMLAWMLGRYPEVRAPVNDVLARVPHLAPFITPIDKFHRQREASRRLHSAFAGDAALLVFPAGATSRYSNGRLRDGRWEKMPVRMARAHDRPIVPVFIDGRLSRRFYALARARRLLGIPLNLEMLLLVDEMFRPATPELGITLGQALSPEALRALGDDDHARAAQLHASCYSLASESATEPQLEARSA